MKQIYYDVGCSHLLFLRYNPDCYKPVEERKQIASFYREETLMKLVKHFCKEENKPSNNLSVLYLFYDGYIESDLQPEAIDIL
jgi:hypothetical protein